MEERILKLLGRPKIGPLNPFEIGQQLGIPRQQQRDVEEILRQMERDGRIARLKQGNRYGLPLEADLVPGRIRMSRGGSARLQPDDPKLGMVAVPSSGTSTAINGDRVLVRRDKKPGVVGRGKRLQETGKVIRILERSRTTIVGTLQRTRAFFYVVPDDPRMPQDIYVPPPADVGRPARPGDKVVVELAEWSNRHVNPEGDVIEVLGPPDAEGVDMLSVIRQYNLPLHFPKPVLQEARSIGTEVPPAELAGRVDCREHLVVTIDPEDAKDFDDAISVTRAGQNRWRLWVHIADVSHYVKTGSALDQEAERRGNSTYLVDRVVPMLPEALSNELCSLKPNVDRLTKAVEFLLDNDGRVLESRFHSAAIRSKRRFNYKEAFALLQQKPADDTERMLHDANHLAQKLRRARFRAGALNLDFPETKILLDEQGRIDRIERVENDISHQLIEEFMLLANEAVARRLRGLRRPALYRIHEDPDEARLREFREEVVAHGIPCGNLAHRQEVRKLLERLDSSPVGAALKVAFLRSLMRARYSVEPLGHYGLAKGDYTHFTSPIRRYADLVVHRALFSRDRKLNLTDLQATADHISETERNSDDAERDSRDVKLFAFLIGQLKSGDLQVYDALVTDLRNFGFFVDVPGLGLSGLVPLSGLNDDFYVLDTARGELIGRRTRRTIKMGDRLKVRVARVDTFKRQVDFELVPGEKRPRLGEKGSGPAQRTSTSPKHPKPSKRHLREKEERLDKRRRVRAERRRR